MLSNRSMPPGTVVPELAYPNVPAAAAWLCAAFGFTERLRIGAHRVQLNVGDGAVVVAEGGPADRAHAVMVRVVDVDRHYETARASGATVSGPPETFPFG